MKNTRSFLLWSLCSVAACAPEARFGDGDGDGNDDDIVLDADGARYLSDLAWLSSSNGSGPVELDRTSGTALAGDGDPISIDGVVHPKGLGVHAPSELRFLLGGACTRFRASVALEDPALSGSVMFEVRADGVMLHDSGLLDADAPPRDIDVDVTGRLELELVVNDGGDGAVGDGAVWASARLHCAIDAPQPPPRAALAWQMIALVIRGTDVTFTDPASAEARRVVTHMTPEEEAAAQLSLRAMPRNIHDWTDGLGRASLDIVTLDDTVRSLSPAQGGYWVGPADVADLLDRYAPTGAYDSIFVIWDPDGSEGNVPTCCFFGQGPGPGTHGATYASIPTFSDRPSDRPGLALIHEWLHGSTYYYRKTRGFAVPDPHDGAQYGYVGDAEEIAWYTAIMDGTLEHLDTGVRKGMDATVWASGTPSRPVGTTMGPPSHLTAVAGSDGISLAWTANSLAHGYAIYRRVDGAELEPRATTTGTSWLDVDVTPGAQHDYVVRSTGSGGTESHDSAPVAASP